MRAALFLTGALASFAAAGPVLVERASDLSAQVVTAIEKVGTDSVALNKTLNTFKADSLLGLFTALKIQQQTKQINTDLTNAASLTNRSASWDSTASSSVATAIINLEPTIFSILDNIVVHKPAFASAVLFVGDLTQTVETDLEEQAELSRELGNAIQSRLSADLAGYAPLITAQIQDKFAAAIAAYQSCTGVVCLPDLAGI